MQTNVDRVAQIRGYLERLADGEDLERVREDFAAEFAEVDPQEILDAEQQLLDSGVPAKRVQALCDVHAALFEGATCGPSEDAFAAAAAAVERVLSKYKTQEAQGTQDAQDAQNTKSGSSDGVEIGGAKLPAGHPLSTLTRENEALSEVYAELEAVLEARDEAAVRELLPRVSELAIHYAKKGDLLYPILEANHGISGPSQVMWAVDGEIRSGFKRAAAAKSADDAWYEQVAALLARAQDMVVKEREILYPLCATNLTGEEWVQVWGDMADYDVCLGVVPAEWPEAAAELEAHKPQAATTGVTISLAGGQLTIDQLQVLLDTLPFEITFVDGDDINRYFNQGHKAFKRPSSALGRNVRECHPPQAKPMVERVLADLRSGARDEVAVWMERGGKPYLVRYLAMRAADKSYLGTVEVVQDMGFAAEHFARK